MASSLRYCRICPPSPRRLLAIRARQGAERAVGELQNLWIAEIKTAAAGGKIRFRQNGVPGIFLIVQPVSEGETLGLDFADLPVGHGLVADAGIHEQLPPVGELNRAAGEASVLVIGHIGRQRAGEKLPMQQIES